MKGRLPMWLTYQSPCSIDGCLMPRMLDSPPRSYAQLTQTRAEGRKNWFKNLSSASSKEPDEGKNFFLATFRDNFVWQIQRTSRAHTFDVSFHKIQRFSSWLDLLLKKAFVKKPFCSLRLTLFSFLISNVTYVDTPNASRSGLKTFWGLSCSFFC